MAQRGGGGWLLLAGQFFLGFVVLFVFVCAILHFMVSYYKCINNSNRTRWIVILTENIIVFSALVAKDIHDYLNGMNEIRT